MSEHDEAVVATLRSARAPRPLGPGPDLDGILRAGAARRERRERRDAAAAASGATALLVGAVVIGSSVLGGGGSPVPVAGPESAAAQRLALLAEPAGPEDVLPDELQGTEVGAVMAPGTVRLVADVDGVGYFAGSSPGGETCVLVHLRAEGSATTTCLAPAEFEAVGLGFGFSAAEGTDVRGVLVPDSWSFEDPDERVRAAVAPGSGLSLDDVVTPNLLARTTDRS